MTMPPREPGDEPPRMAVTAMTVGTDGETVVFQYAPDRTVAMPAGMARQLAHAFLRCADECDGRRSFLFMHGAPDPRRPEARGRS